MVYNCFCCSHFSSFLLQFFIVSCIFISRSVSQNNGVYSNYYIRDTCRCETVDCTTGRRPATSTLYPLEGDNIGAGHLLLSRDPFGGARDTAGDYRCAYTIRAPASMTIVLRVNSVNIPLDSHPAVLPPSPVHVQNLISPERQQLHELGSESASSASTKVQTRGSVPLMMTSSLKTVTSDGGCRVAALQIYDGNTTDDVSKQLVEMCGSALPTETVFSSTSSELTLNYYQLMNVELDFKSFNLTFTYVANRPNETRFFLPPYPAWNQPWQASYASRSGNISCLSGEFACKSIRHQCIASSLLCDSIENCPDGSDESTDYDNCGRFMPSSNPFIGTTLGGGLAIIIGVMLLIIAVQSRHRPSTRTVNRRTNAIPVSPEAEQSQDGFIHATSVDNFTTTSSSEQRLVSCQADVQGQGHTFQPLILVTRSRHVTVVAMAPNGSASTDRAVVMSTPPPAYDSLFPETASIADDTLHASGD